MSWTWDREKEGDYLEYCVTYKEYKNGHVEIINIEPKYNVSKYFRQQEYIQGTYIRKDKFQEILLKKKLQEVDEFIDLNYKPLNDHLWIRVEEWNNYVGWVSSQMGVPEKFTNNEL